MTSLLCDLSSSVKHAKVWKERNITTSFYIIVCHTEQAELSFHIQALSQPVFVGFNMKEVNNRRLQRSHVVLGIITGFDFFRNVFGLLVSIQLPLHNYIEVS